MNGIEKLEQRLAADPASKVFVPLAEEYRKAGHLDRALAVLRAGLGRNPGYASARVALARVHLQRGELVEARELLTLLVAEAPDNLLAVRLLDETGPPAAAGAEPEAVAPDTAAPQAMAVETAAVEAAAPEPTPDPEPTAAAPIAARTPAVTTLPPASMVAETVRPSEPAPTPTPTPAPEPPPTWATQRLSRDAVLAQLASASGYDALTDHTPVAPPEPAPPRPAAGGDDWRHGFEALSEGEPEPSIADALPALGELPVDPIEISAPEPVVPEMLAPETAEPETFAPAAIASAPAEPEPVMEAVPPASPDPGPEADEAEAPEPMRVAEPPAPAVVRTLTLARLYRRQGHFDRAARVYRDLLDLDPTNTEARRELGELCGEGLADITDEDVVSREEAPATALPRAHAETLAAVRQRKIEYLRSWLDQMRSEG